MKTNNLLLVTGASSGIGREISRKLCKEGYEVILASRSKEKLYSLHNQLKKEGYKSHVIPCDIRIEKEVNNLYKESKGRKRVSQKGIGDYILELFQKGLDKEDGYDLRTLKKWKI